MLIQRIKLKNILSFGPDAPELELKPLNVLIGPNGSGKSNLIEVIGLLKGRAGGHIQAHTRGRRNRGLDLARATEGWICGSRGRCRLPSRPTAASLRIRFR